NDNTVVKIMLTAVITGMTGIYLLKEFKLVSLYPKQGSFGINAVGGLIFGVGFAVLGYCPGTIAGAIGNGYIDAAIGGTAGILAGSYLYAMLYPKAFIKLNNFGNYGNKTLPELLRVNDWVMIFFTVAFL
ncbi:MAG: YeeE/YedE family protein, partial [Candidatus Uhrbacteria bacterium GW2011_GWF2_39_13]